MSPTSGAACVFVSQDATNLCNFSSWVAVSWVTVKVTHYCQDAKVVPCPSGALPLDGATAEEPFVGSTIGAN
ncbi:hypothetical protein Vi05172_g13562 [Venturia inaequalis]|nr:hypothetical protein Vi05172_g13562 [Venturia inaequalis]